MVNAGREFLAPLLADEDLKLREPEGIRLLWAPRIQPFSKIMARIAASASCTATYRE